MAERVCSECGTRRTKESLLERFWPRGYYFDQSWACSERCFRFSLRAWIGRTLEFPMMELDQSHRIRIGALLVQKGLITGDQLAFALERQRTEGGALGYQIIRQGFCTETQLTAALSEQQGVPWVGEVKLPVDRSFCLEIPLKLSRDYQVFPFEFDFRTSTLMMAARSPVRIHLNHLIRKMLGYNVRVFLVQDATFDSAFDEYLRIPRKDEEVVLKATRNPREITDFLVRELQKRGGRSLRLGSYDRGFWARTELERQRLDCFVSLATVDQFAGEGRQSLPESSVYVQ